MEHTTIFEEDDCDMIVYCDGQGNMISEAFAPHDYDFFYEEPMPTQIGFVVYDDSDVSNPTVPTIDTKPPVKKKITKKKTTEDITRGRGRPRKTPDLLEECVPKKPRGRPKKEVSNTPKRAPTLYNLFVKEHLPTINTQHPEKSKKERMEMISVMWKASKST
jgi:hypothetical protein